ncbi:hypothetical protein [Ammoniphilus oxalaticus]|uniref:hypothetical protein n=1 Tax=Ammoniphilus oxalaticus TaxID=66863 RepID=UPI001474D37B|nr:hypothetical protein [Ammoniphilus oxalaticus]
MELLHRELDTISDQQELTSIKEQLKEQVLEKMSWQDRMNLYKQIQNINERLENLKIES